MNPNPEIDAGLADIAADAATVRGFDDFLEPDAVPKLRRLTTTVTMTPTFEAALQNQDPLTRQTWCAVIARVQANPHHPVTRISPEALDLWSTPTPTGHVLYFKHTTESLVWFAAIHAA